MAKKETECECNKVSQAAKVADKKRTEKETIQTQQELEEIKIVENPFLIQCPKCGEEVNPWIGSHYNQTCSKCGHSWSLVKDFKKNEER